MSRNVLNCRVCRRPMVRTHHNGRVEILAVIEGRSSAHVRLRCQCGEVREWVRRD
jgi:hypothetical protein